MVLLLMSCMRLPHAQFCGLKQRVALTGHNSANSILTSNLVCIKEVAIRTTFSYIINTAGIIYYTCSLIIDIQCTHYENVFNKLF